MALSSRSQIKYGALISYGALFFNIVAALLYTPWMVKEIGQSNYGLYTLASSFISLFLMDFGISAALARYLSKYNAENRIEEAKDILGATYILYLAIDAVILIILSSVYFNLDHIYDNLSSDELETFKILFLIVGLFNIISFPAMTFNGILTSHGKFVHLKICDLCSKILSIIFVILALSLNLGVVAVVSANIAANVIILIIKLFIIKTIIPLRPNFKKINKSVYKSIFHFSVWLTVIAFAQRFVYNITPSILGIVAGTIAISIYAPASALGSYYYSLASAINGLFLPHISRKVAENKMEDVQLLMEKVGKFQLFLLGWIFVCFVCIGKFFMILWMGEKFELSYYCGMLVFFPAMFEYSQQIGTTLIVAENKVKYQAIGFIIISVISLGISFVLGYVGGAVGICISICLAGLANVLLQKWIFSSKLHLDMKAFNRKCVYPFILPFIITIILGYWISSFFTITWLNFIFLAFLVTIIYFSTTYLMAIKREEITFFLNVVKR